MSVVAMRHGELSRYDTLRHFERGELRIEDAALLIGEYIANATTAVHAARIHRRCDQRAHAVNGRRSETPYRRRKMALTQF